MIYDDVELNTIDVSVFVGFEGFVSNEEPIVLTSVDDTEFDGLEVFDYEIFVLIGIDDSIIADDEDSIVDGEEPLLFVWIGFMIIYGEEL